MTREQRVRIEQRMTRLRSQMDPQDRSTIAGALRVAAEQYLLDADANAGTRLGEQFIRQSEECSEIAKGLEL